MPVTLNINGAVHELDVDPDKPLLWVLREELGLTGSKYGCGAGHCRACSVLVDGQPTRSCLYPASSMEGRAVQTIEGLSDDLAEALRDAWAATGVSQCGYCQPGQIVSAYALLSERDDPGEDEIAQGVPNLCRCGTYQRIAEAIQSVAAARRGGR